RELFIVSVRGRVFGVRGSRFSSHGFAFEIGHGCLLAASGKCEQNWKKCRAHWVGIHDLITCGGGALTSMLRRPRRKTRLRKRLIHYGSVISKPTTVGHWPATPPRNNHTYQVKFSLTKCRKLPKIRCLVVSATQVGGYSATRAALAKVLVFGQPKCSIIWS